MPRGKAHARARLSRTGKPWWRRRSNRRHHVSADRDRGNRRSVATCPARCWRSDRATAASRRMQAAKYRTLGVKIAAPAVVDSERLSPGRDRRRHPRQVQRCRSCLREHKIMPPTDLRGGALAIEEAAPFRGGQLGARNPRRLERTGYDHAKGHEAHADDEIPHHSRLLFSFVRRVPPLVRHVPGPVQTSLIRGVGSPMIRAGGLDSAPPICTLARFEVRAS